MTYPVVTIKPSYNSIVRGCPGIADTLPRIECELRIRSNDGNPFSIDRIEIFLKNVEVVNNTHATGLTTKSKFEKKTLYYKKKLRINTESMKTNEILGLDVPITIGIPDSIKATNYNVKFGHTYTYFDCIVYYKLPKQFSNQAAISKFEMPINIERYNIYPNLKMFPPIKQKDCSPDNRIQLKYKLNSTCFGTDDLIHIDFEFKPNVGRHRNCSTTGTNANTHNNNSHTNSAKKLKIKTITVEVRELLEIATGQNDSDPNHPSIGSSSTNNNTSSMSGLESRENIIISVSKPINQLIGANGYKTFIDLKLLTINPAFKNYYTALLDPVAIYKLPKQKTSDTLPQITLIKAKSGNDSISSANSGNIGGEPLVYHSSLTTMGRLYSVTHDLIIRFKCSGNLKSFEITQPITISHWCKPQVKYIENIIRDEREIAINAKQFYDRYGGIKRIRRSDVLEYPPLPPIVFPYTKETMETLGIKYEKVGHKHLRRLPVIE
ncbi:uncharacterized protein SCODWIG_01640 [Saccharomycodes ludwigii]|uniref:Arrestin C-terminal-like domain-containing protein n=1 Tax=Saccharomycodes ludwigii TaxID=36035 RepID=A0A376B5N2_9ASCO|nr:hypothetical protein SCDLUD_001999 [Saccharomycodes ludwigii]KAH3902184.1 hypothetical protein SCDLUD_001999 [Saccharomycodes ludwigii]SSD59879.1 uncharacterized protein SCODWIG_01640 [Saccharomycodes ludwigii]